MQWLSGHMTSEVPVTHNPRGMSNQPLLKPEQTHSVFSAVRGYIRHITEEKEPKKRNQQVWWKRTAFRTQASITLQEDTLLWEFNNGF